MCLNTDVRLGRHDNPHKLRKTGQKLSRIGNHLLRLIGCQTGLCRQPDPCCTVSMVSTNSR
jgi:hypothetical protein